MPADLDETDGRLGLLYNRKSEDVIQHWLGELKDTAFIEYHLDE